MGNEEVREPQSVGGESINPRGADVLSAVASHVAVPEIIGENEDHVWGWFCCDGGLARDGKPRAEADEEDSESAHLSTVLMAAAAAFPRNSLPSGVKCTSLGF